METEQHSNWLGLQYAVDVTPSGISFTARDKDDIVVAMIKVVMLRS
jgi:hypothetical protein